MTKKIKASNIDTGAVTADKLHTTAITDKLGFTPVTPTQLSTAVAAVDLTGLATETFVTTAVSNLVNAAPSTLDTLNELAAALGNDANYATTITTALGTKVDKINITGATVGSTSNVPVITYNAQGQITATSTVTDLSLTSLSVTGGLNQSVSVTKNASVDNRYIKLIDSGTSGTRWDLLNRAGNVPGSFAIFDSTNSVARLTIDSSGNVTTGAHIVGTRAQYDLMRGSDFTTSTYGANYNSLMPNGVYYAVGALTNAPFSNNAIVTYHSSLGLSATYEVDTVHERAVQLYYGDTPGYAYRRVKQGGVIGWHPWERVMSSATPGTTVAAYTVTDAAHYFTDNQSGFTFLEVTFTPQRSTNKFLVMATVNGAAGDDASAVIQRLTGGSWSEPDELRGIASNSGFRGSFGDWSITRVTEDKQTLQYTAVYLDQPNASGLVGYRVRLTAENVTGFWINRPTGTDGGYNTNSSRSTMVILEIVA